MTNERIWLGNDFPATRVLVLGESWYGAYEGDLATDAGWIQAYLAKRVTDRMYSKIANSCGMPRENYWHGVAYTNYVQCVGAMPSARPTSQQYIDAKPRLCKLLLELAPRGVWVLGEEQAGYSAPVMTAMSIAFEVAPHPARRGVTNNILGESWRRLQKRMNIGANDDSGGGQPETPRLNQCRIDFERTRMPTTKSNMKLVVSNAADPLAVKKYPFPKAAPVYDLTINGKKCPAANTQGGSPLRMYTYFVWEGNSYYVSGHISPLETLRLVEE